MQTCDPLSQLESPVLQTQILQSLILLNQIPTLYTQSSEEARLLGTDMGAAKSKDHHLCSRNLKKCFSSLSIAFEFRGDNLEEPRK